MSSKQRTWWQEMGAISRGMMFLDGSFVAPDSPQQAERAAHVVQAAMPPSQLRTRPRANRLKRKAQWLLEALMLLGGRPTTVRHNDDIDEPFPPRHRRKNTNRPRRTSTATDCATC